MIVKAKKGNTADLKSAGNQVVEEGEARTGSDLWRLNKVRAGALLETKVKGGKLQRMMASSFTSLEFYSSYDIEGHILVLWRKNYAQVEVMEESK
uniref:Uncharacterized protein n=1 Tax=Cannabis sativa TaxID=3483 RepID=A0A803Q0N3_CANSA